MAPTLFTPDNPLRLGILLSGGGRTMVNLQQHIRQGRLPAEIAVVIASRDCKGVTLAQDDGLDVHVVPFKQMPDLQTYSDHIAALLDEAKVDLVVMAGFLSPWTIPAKYENRVINIHPALLPAFGGKGMYGHRVHEAVLKTGCKISGCTVHFVTNEYDRGPIIVQKAVPVLDSDTPDDLAARVFQQELSALPEALNLYTQGRLTVEGDVVRVR